MNIIIYIQIHCNIYNIIFIRSLQYNSLTGNIPYSFSQLENLTEL